MGNLWESAALALAFGLAFIACMFFCFKYAYIEAGKIILAAFAKAQSEYNESRSATPLPTPARMSEAEEVDSLLRTPKGSAHPVPDLPLAPSDFGQRRDPTNFATNLKTERAKRGRG